MIIGIVSDDKSISQKSKILKYLSKKHQVIDLNMNTGTNIGSITASMVNAINNKKVEKIISISEYGIEYTIEANRFTSLRCAKVDNTKEAKVLDKYNINVISLSNKCPIYRMKDILDVSIKPVKVKNVPTQMVTQPVQNQPIVDNSRFKKNVK